MTRMSLRIGFALFSFVYLFPYPAASQDISTEPVQLEPVVVTTTRGEQPAGDVTDSVTIIPSQEYETGAAPLVIDELRRVPGAQVQRSGSIGEQTVVRLRGGEKNQVLVLYDGIRLNATYDRVADIAVSTAISLDRVEVVRGTFSALYGSDAIGGVINIIPAPGRSLNGLGGRKFQVSVGVEGGSMRTLTESLNLYSQSEIHAVSLGVSRIDTNGQNDRDGFSGTYTSGRFQLLVPGGGELTLSAVYSNSEKELYLDTPLSLYVQNMMFTLARDSNFSAGRDLALAGFSFRQPVLEIGAATLYGSASWSGTDLTNPADPDISDYHVSEIENTRRGAGALFDLTLIEENEVLLGMEYFEEDAEEDMESNLPTGGMGSPMEFVIEGKKFERAIYLEDRLKISGRYFLNAGVRFDFSSDVPGDEVFISPRGSAAVKLSESGTKLRGGVGRGYRSPSVNERFFPMKGNPELEPEEAWSYEAGVEQKIDQYNVALSGTFFYIDFENIIGAVPGFVALQNTEQARSYGLEAEVAWRPLDWLSLRAGYTFNKAEKETTLMNELGDFEEKWVDFFWRPRNNIFTEIEARPIENLRVRLSGEYRGEYDEPHDIMDQPYDYLDPDGDILSGDNPGFTVFNLYSEYRIPYTLAAEEVEVFLRIENLFDADYFEAKGYPAPGISAYGGVKVRI